MIFATNKKQAIRNKRQEIEHKKHTGFTFVELLIVIAIIGVLAGIVVPNLKTTQSNFALDGFVKDIYYLTKYLQVSASTHSRIYRLDIAQAQGSRTLFSARYKNKDGEFIPLGGRFKNAYAMPPDATIYSIEPADITNIFFYPDASMDNARIVFKNKFGKEMILTLKETGAAIQVR